MPVDVAHPQRASTAPVDRGTMPVTVKATRHHPDPMEGLWLGMLLCAPVWAAVLLLIR